MFDCGGAVWRLLDISGALQLGMQFADQDVTVRLDDHLLHVITGVLAKTPPSPISADQRTRIRGARPAAGSLPSRRPVSVKRCLPKEGVIMVKSATAPRRPRARREGRHCHHRRHPLRVVRNGEELSLPP